MKVADSIVHYISITHTHVTVLFFRGHGKNEAVNELGRQRLQRQNSLQQGKHTKLYSDLYSWHEKGNL